MLIYWNAIICAAASDVDWVKLGALTVLFDHNPTTQEEHKLWMALLLP